MRKRSDKKGEGLSSLGMLGGLILVAVLVVIVIYFIFQGQGVGDNILDVIPSNLAILVSGCEGISQTGDAFLSASCGDFKDLGKVEGHARYGNCEYVLKRYQKSGSNIDCDNFNVDVAAKEFCIAENLKKTDMVNDKNCGSLVTYDANGNIISDYKGI